MKITEIPIEASRFIELDYDFTKHKKFRIPMNLKGAIVRVNLVYRKGEYNQDKIDKIINEIKQQKPAKVMFGNPKMIIDTTKREAQKLDVNMSRSELVDEYINKFAPDNLKADIKKIASDI